MRKWLCLILAISLIALAGCATPEAPVEEPVPEVEEVEVTPEPEPEVEAAVEVAPEPEVVEEPEEEPFDNQLVEGAIDLQNFKGSPEDILFAYLNDLDKIEMKATSQRKYMNWELVHPGKAKIYYPKWAEITPEYMKKEGELIGAVWMQADEGTSNYFDATLHDFKGVIQGTVKVRKGTVTWEAK